MCHSMRVLWQKQYKVEKVQFLHEILQELWILIAYY